MAWLTGFLIFVEALCSLLLIVVVLMQRTKGEGLGMAFGGQMGESLFGARAGNVLVKITIWLGIIFLVNTTFLAMIYSRTDAASSVMDKFAPTSGPGPVQQQPSQDSPFMPMDLPDTGSTEPVSAPDPGFAEPVSVPEPDFTEPVSVQATVPVEVDATAPDTEVEIDFSVEE